MYHILVKPLHNMVCNNMVGNIPKPSTLDIVVKSLQNSAVIILNLVVFG